LKRGRHTSVIVASERGWTFSRRRNSLVTLGGPGRWGGEQKRSVIAFSYEKSVCSVEEGQAIQERSNRVMFPERGKQ